MVCGQSMSFSLHLFILASSTLERGLQNKTHYQLAVKKCDGSDHQTAPLTL